MTTTTKETHARLRLAFVDGVAVVPRRYAQSTSGRSGSQRTTPPLSRSKSITSASRIRSRLEMALRRYPSDVLQRKAYDSCSVTGNEFRYVRSGSTSIAGSIGRESLPSGKPLSIPLGRLPNGTTDYDGHMDARKTANELKSRIRELRYKKLQDLLRDRYNDSPVDFCRETGYDKPDVISQLTGRHRSFGEDLARELELWAGLERYELEREDDSRSWKAAKSGDWPFSISQEEFMALSGKSRADINSAIYKMVMGAQSEEMVEKQRKRGKKA